MRHSWTILFILTSVVVAAAGRADSLHPSGSAVIASTALSSSTVAVGDTIVISRQIINGEPYPLSGVYLSEHLPPEFTVMSSSLTIDGVPAAVDDSVLPSGSVLSGYVSHYWVIGSPSGGTDLSPGESLQLEITVTCSSEGSFTLPLHAMAGYGNGSGVFSVGDPSTITVTSPADTTPPSMITNLSVTSGNSSPPVGPALPQSTRHKTPAGKCSAGVFICDTVSGIRDQLR